MCPPETLEVPREHCDNNRCWDVINSFNLFPSQELPSQVCFCADRSCPGRDITGCLSCVVFRDLPESRVSLSGSSSKLSVTCGKEAAIPTVASARFREIRSRWETGIRRTREAGREAESSIPGLVLRDQKVLSLSQGCKPAEREECLVGGIGACTPTHSALWFCSAGWCSVDPWC